MYYAYILQLNDNTYYHGFSENLRERIKDHNSGTVSATKNLRPLQLVFYAAFSSKKKALDFETYLKTQSGYAFRNKRLIDK
jgi:putative endonuclease